MRFARTHGRECSAKRRCGCSNAGAAHAALGQTADAEQDLRNALLSEGRPWVLGRSHFELGKLP